MQIEISQYERALLDRRRPIVIWAVEWEDAGETRASYHDTEQAAHEAAYCLLDATVNNRRPS